MGNVYFAEIQKFPKTIGIIVIFITWAAFVFISFFVNDYGQIFAVNAVSFILFGIIFPVFYFSLKLATEVREDGVYIKLFPIHFSFRKAVFPEEIKRYMIKIYNPLKEYGGWGIRFGKNGRAYNAKGNEGILFELKDGKNILIGTQKPQEFSAAVNKMLNE